MDMRRMRELAGVEGDKLEEWTQPSNLAEAAAVSGDVLIRPAGSNVDVYVMGSGKRMENVARSTTLLRQRALTIYRPNAHTVPAKDFTPRNAQKDPIRLIKKYLPDLLTRSPQVFVWRTYGYAPVGRAEAAKSRGPQTLTVTRVDPDSQEEYEVKFRAGDKIYRWMGHARGFAPETLFAISTTKLKDKSRGPLFAQGPRLNAGTSKSHSDWEYWGMFYTQDEVDRR